MSLFKRRNVGGVGINNSILLGIKKRVSTPCKDSTLSISLQQHKDNSFTNIQMLLTQTIINNKYILTLLYFNQFVKFSLRFT